MQNNSDNKDKDTIICTGEFEYIKKKVYCCKKILHLQFELTNEHLKFFEDREKTREFLIIPRTAVIAINKRQINRFDVNKLSIYYREENSNKIKELRIKARSRSENNTWIFTLRKEINPQRYQFEYNKESLRDSSEIYPMLNQEKFYIKLCHLEYLIARKKMQNLFVIYKDSNMEIINQDADSQSELFGSKQDNDKENIEENIIKPEDIKPEV